MDRQRNVLFICVDEWPGNLVGYRGRTDVMTPTLDFLAANGVAMENAYSECPVCIPARRSLMTGLSPRHHGDRVYSDRNKTIQLGIQMFTGIYSTEYGLIMATSVLAIIPVLVVFLAFQRFFVEGIASSGLNG